MAFKPNEIEPKWQAFWEVNQTFRAIDLSEKPKYYVLDMFPYPSSNGLHVGHSEGYTASDILSRYKRAKGFNVLHPMGWDAFGLPAEQYALRTGVHPAETTKNAIDNFRRQLKSLGFSFDWSREFSTADPSFYRWTQSLFLKLYEKGLVYQKEAAVNWCPHLNTVLANEEVKNGLSERGAHPVFRVPMRQWMIRITDYAERLLEGLEGLDWPESTKQLQRNWIGKSEGLKLSFEIFSQSDLKIEVFTSRPETLFGVSFIVLAPENPLIPKLLSSQQKSLVESYVQVAARKSELDRQSVSLEQTGVFTGAFVLHPFSGEKLPVWISDYVLAHYGTGAVMGVPAHDQRDFEFAKKFQLPLRTVIDEASGTLIDSGFISGLTVSEARGQIIKKAEKEGLGEKTIQYRLRDWLFSRQRYWGEPFPIVYEDGKPKPLEEASLPVLLPEVSSYEPAGLGKSPLASVESWTHYMDAKTGKTLLRETNTMPGSAGSSWYFLRFCDPHNKKQAFSTENQSYWMPVDFYLGGPEHAVGHLLYARFWTKVLFDAGLVSVDEPFQRLVHQGMILGEDGEKMSKTRGNTISPDEVIAQYGADTLRVYEMFMGPLDRDKPWSTGAIEGVYRFLQRVWRLFLDEEDQLCVSQEKPSAQAQKILHQTIRKVTEDIENLNFNTAISQMMIFVNFFTKNRVKPRSCLQPFIQLLNPFAPHLAEELWSRLVVEKPMQKDEGQASLSFEPWPVFDSELARESYVRVAIQVLGKTRAFVELPSGSLVEQVEAKAREIASIGAALEGRSIQKKIFVSDRILNFVLFEKTK